MASLRYLTLQDMIWINAQVTGATQEFDYSRLEEATFFQYGYGGSMDIFAQSSRFLSGFAKLAPFGVGNEATAFVGFAAFLLMNGRRLTVSDSGAAAWAGSIGAGDGEKVKSKTVEYEEHGIGVEEAVREVMGEFGGAVGELLAAIRASA